MKVVYLARNDGTDMRVSKECMSLAHKGYNVHFVGWRPNDGEDRPDPMPDVEKHFYTPPPHTGLGGKLLRFPGFVRYVIGSIRRLRPDVVHAVNEELALIAIGLSKRLGFRSVCDVFDSLELKYGDQLFPVSMAARSMTRFVHKHVDALIVTDEARRQRLGGLSSKARVVANYPVDTGAEVAYKLPNSDGIVKIYVAGTLYRERGLQSILDLALHRKDVRIVSAGWVFDDAARAFVSHPAVDYRGVLTAAESLRLAASCHAILALYEPSCENNIMASPNKIYDALCVGRPVIINRETLVSEWVSKMNAGYVVSYGNNADLSTVLDDIKGSDLLYTAERLRTLFKCGYSWDVAECELFSVYTALTRKGPIYATA